ncbi:filamentous hemagglutinin N-terminal domain-containing protein [uncultured Pseudoteredinibacter sp.]|uniref:filamentous hemagglutinin N-terminal domain-containing protein n=1 Tax=uncultured Pseudoteredinibacter sp. TaxID=1641701 RepID=UPI002633811F|nr:filamentous hemagglutinin N-terminal domain-containing protein [uncultured Pseudoteredinibacter sp.]
MPLKSSTRSSVASISVALVCCLNTALSAANNVVPDGSTATSVAQVGGRTEVQIAPANEDRTSYNRYQKFDVSAEGVALNNREVAARTIVNEVTGGELSTLAGQIEVLGTKAHIVIANTNGISVDGLNFINTADTLLTTGSVSTVERTLGPGVQQLNTLLDTQVGTIVVGEGGISGAMSSLDLIANAIEVNGPILNSEIGRRNQVRLLPGKSITELDSSLSPSNPTRNVAINQQSEDGNQSVLVRMSQNASIEAGSILIAVTAKGAGVKLDGELIANSGNFVLSTDGEISSAASIRAAGHLAIRSSGNVTLSSDIEREQTEVAAGNGISVQSEGRFSSEGVLLSAAVDVPSEGEDAIAAIDIEAEKGIEQSSLNGDHLGILFAASGDISLRSAGDITNYNGRMISNGALAIETPGAFKNLLSFNDFEGRGEIQQSETIGSRRWYTLFLKREKRRELWADFGRMDIDGELPTLVADGDLDIVADHISNVGGNFISNGGDILLDAKTVHNEAVALGELRFSSHCVISCDQFGQSTVQLFGGSIQAANDTELQASESFYNLGGTVFSVANTRITTPLITNEAITIPNVFQRRKGLAGFFNHRTGHVFRQDQGGALIANMGRLVINSDAEIYQIGGFFQSGEDEDIPVDINIVRERINQSPVNGEAIGLFGSAL